MISVGHKAGLELSATHVVAKSSSGEKPGHCNFRNMRSRSNGGNTIRDVQMLKPPHIRLVSTMDICSWVSECFHLCYEYKNYARCWEIWDEYGNILIIVGIAKALLGGRVWLAVSHAIVSRGEHNGDATSTCHPLSENHS